MKKYVLVAILALSSLSCNSQNKDSTANETQNRKDELEETPKGSWKVDKEFDENGNLIRYDSIYSWSSNNKIEHLTEKDKDSVIASMKSRFFKNFSKFEDQGFDQLFANDSLFTNRFFNDDFFNSDFGSEFMDIDRIRQQMLERQRRFLEKYQSEFIKPENEKSQ